MRCPLPGSWKLDAPLNMMIRLETHEWLKKNKSCKKGVSERFWEKHLSCVMKKIPVHCTRPSKPVKKCLPPGQRPKKSSTTVQWSHMFYSTWSESILHAKSVYFAEFRIIKSFNHFIKYRAEDFRGLGFFTSGHGGGGRVFSTPC